MNDMHSHSSLPDNGIARFKKHDLHGLSLQIVETPWQGVSTGVNGEKCFIYTTGRVASSPLFHFRDRSTHMTR